MSSTGTAIEPLSTAWLLVGGGIGGFAGFVGATALPYFRSLVDGEIKGKPSIAQMLGVLGAVVGNTLMGGVAAIFVGDAVDIGQAIAFGLAWQAVLKGAGEGAQLLGSATGKAKPEVQGGANEAGGSP